MLEFGRTGLQFRDFAKHKLITRFSVIDMFQVYENERTLYKEPE